MCFKLMNVGLLYTPVSIYRAWTPFHVFLVGG